MEEWKNDEICIKALRTRIAEKYTDFKMRELKEYEPHQPADKNEVTQWEIQKYLYA